MPVAASGLCHGGSHCSRHIHTWDGLEVCPYYLISAEYAVFLCGRVEPQHVSSLTPALLHMRRFRPPEKLVGQKLVLCGITDTKFRPMQRVMAV